jgi:hypothetical protein
VPVIGAADPALPAATLLPALPWLLFVLDALGAELGFELDEEGDE